MAGKGYNYADDYDDDWYDEDDNDMPDFEEEEDPELAAAVKAAAQQKKPANVKAGASTSGSRLGPSAKQVQRAAGGLGAAGAGASALAHHLCDHPPSSRVPGKKGAAAVVAQTFPIAPQPRPGGAGAVEPFRFDVPSPDDQVRSARTGAQQPARQAEQATPQTPPAAPAAGVQPRTPAADLASAVQRLDLGNGVSSREQGRAGIRPTETDSPSTSSRPDQPQQQRRQRPLSEYRLEPDLAKALEEVAASQGDSSGAAAGKPRLHLVVLGHVDAGKSTLMGRLLHDLGQASAKAVHKAAREAAAAGKGSFAWAWLLDERPEERARGVTVDVAGLNFDTPSRGVRLLDAPGHRDFVPNMIVGAAQADAALLLVDGSPGGFEAGFESAPAPGSAPGRGGQTREHAQLARSLGVEQLAVVVSKLDTCGYSQERFEQIKAALQPFLRASGFRDGAVQWLPAVGPVGENLVRPPQEPALAAWWRGPTLVQAIDAFRLAPRGAERPLRMPVSDVFKGARGGIAVGGKLEAGALKVGTRVLVQPGGHAGSVRSVEVGGRPVPAARAGDTADVALTGIDMAVLAAGCVLCHPDWPAPVARVLQARVVVLDVPLPVLQGRQVSVHVHAAHEPGHVSRLVALLDAKTGEVRKARPRALARGATALVEVTLERALCAEAYADCRALGRVALRDGGHTLAVGVVTALLEEGL